MKTILAIDPNPADLEYLRQCLSDLHPKSRVLPYTDPLLAFQYAYNHRIDAVFTVVYMRRLDGFRFAQMVWNILPQTAIYFIESNYDEQSYAQKLGAAGYFIKPVAPEDILKRETEYQRKGAQG